MLETEMAMKSPTGQSPVSLAFDGLSNAIGRLDSVVDATIGKIIPILGPEPDNKALGVDPSPESSELVRHINNQADQIEQIANKLQYQISRIEL